MRYLSLILVYLLCLNAFGQETNIRVSGTVSYANKKINIPKARIHSNINEDFSDSEGAYSVKIRGYEKGKTDTLTVSHPGFQTQKIVLSKSFFKRHPERPIQLDIEMKNKELDLFQVSVQKIDTVYGSPKYFVKDFIVKDDESMILLVYENSTSKESYIKFFDPSSKISTIPIKVNGEAEYLFTDFRGNHYVVCRYKVFVILKHRMNPVLLKTSKEDFYGFSYRVLDSIGTDLYHTNYLEVYPSVDIQYTSKLDTVETKLITVQDDFMMELYRAQYKYVDGREKLWAFKKEKETGIDKEIWVGAKSFTSNILYEPVYAPVFVINDTLHVFDQYDSYLYKFDKHHECVDSITVDYYLKSAGQKWEQPLLLDETSQKIYGLYNKGGYTYIRKIDRNSGITEGGMKLNFRFVEKIYIQNGVIYYLYRPFDSAQKTFLYSEKMPKSMR